MAIILEDTKKALGIISDNLGFDFELLMHINSAKANLIHLGVAEMDISIDETTVWPTFPNLVLEGVVQHYIYAKVKQSFDPSASETISRTMSGFINEAEGRIAHEVAEVLDAG